MSLQAAVLRWKLFNGELTDDSCVCHGNNRDMVVLAELRVAVTILVWAWSLAMGVSWARQYTVSYQCISSESVRL